MSERTDLSRLVVITNRQLCHDDFLTRLSVLADMGVGKIIVREKDLPDNEYAKLFSDIKKVCSNTQTQIIGNYFEDISKSCHADGFQYSYNKFMEKSSRKFKTEGVSVHSLEEALNAEKNGADHLIAGHIFQTDCKKGLPPRGLDFLKKICDNVNIPVYAIGGINTENYQGCINVGAYGVCIMSLAMNGNLQKIKEEF